MLMDARDSLSPPLPAREGQRLRSGRLRTLPITAGDQGDPQGGNDTAPPDVRNDVGFTLALSATGPRTTPTCLAVVVEGTPLWQVNLFAGGLYSSSEEEDDSPPSWTFRRCSNSSHLLLCRPWLLHWIRIQWRLCWAP